MATAHKLYVPTHPGQLGGKRIEEYHMPAEDGAGAYGSAFLQGQLFKKNTFPIIGGGIPYVAGEFTLTAGGTSDAQAVATTAGGGLLITLPSDDDFDTTLDSGWGFTPTAGKRVTFRARIQVSDLDGIGFKLGFTTGGGAAALPFGTNYTDVIAFSKAILAGAVVGTVRGNSGTAANTGTLGTMADATEIEVGFDCLIHATSPHGSWYYNGTVTPFTADQLTQVIALLTTPQTLYATVHATGVTATTPTITVTALFAQVDN